MAKKLYSEQDLKRLFSGLGVKRITDRMMDVLLQHCYNKPYNNRYSGFYYAGGGDSVLEWDDATRTMTLKPLVPDTGEDVYDPATGKIYVPNYKFYTWYREPVLHKREEEDTVTLPEEEGLYMIRFVVDEESSSWKLGFVKNPEPEDIEETYLYGVIVAWVYWDAVAGEAIYAGDSRHGSEWNPQMHWVWHRTFNSQRQEGIGLTNLTIDGDGKENEDWQFGISAGKLWHEDIYAEKEAVAADKAIPVFYKEAGGLWRQSEAGAAKFLNAGSGRAAYNSAAGGMAEADDNNFVAYHYFATNCMINSHVAAAGQAQFSTIGEAVSSVAAEVATLKREMPHSNLMYIGSVILQTSDDYTNSTKTRVVWNNDDTDTFVTDVEFNDATRTLTIYQNNNKESLTVVIPGGGGGGTPGEDAYVHFKFSDDGGTTFTASGGTVPGEWLGFYSDHTAAASNTPGDYTWVKIKGDKGSDGTPGTPGTPGADGKDGDDGTSVYTYVAYASNNTGTGFSLTPTNLLKYRAEIHVATELTPPVAADFAGSTWIKYIGDDGGGSGPGGAEPPELHIEFGKAGLDFTYPVPYGMKFTSQVSENGDATVDPPLNTNLSRYDRVTITATVAGLISLYGEYI